MTIEPIRVSFTVGATPQAAYDLWARRIDAWWPPAKSFAGGDVTVVFEAEPGGRIFERANDGSERDWGRVTAAEPPRRLAYTWHLMFDASDATDVEVTFTPEGDGTRVELVHSGWERLGAEIGRERRDRNEAGWSAIARVFATAVGEHAG